MMIIFWIYQLSLLMLAQADSRDREVILTISNLTALEMDLLKNGVDSWAAEMIYGAASCSLKRNRELDLKLNKLISPIEEIGASVNKILNELAMKKGNLTKAKGTLELMIQHRLTNEPEREEFYEQVESVPEPRVVPAFTTSGQAEYLAYSSTVTVVDPETCKTYEVVKGLIKQSKHRRDELVSLARSVYGFSGQPTVSKLAHFYYEYTKMHYDERTRVMGLAKLLGDYASIVSETYFLEEAFYKNAPNCGIKIEHLRKRRNVMQSQIGTGSCTRRYGKWDPLMRNVSFLSKVPHSITIRKESLLNLGMCSDFQSAWNGVIENGEYRSAISASFKEGVQSCVKIAICPEKMVFNGTSCIAGSPIGDFSNINNLELSVITNRVTIDEVPMELKSFGKTYCSIQGKQVNTGKLCEKPIRSTERFTLFSLAGTWMVTDKDVLIAHGQDTTNICFYDCTEGCPGGCLQCQGDEPYESVFGSWLDASCKCKYCSNCSDIYLQIEGAKVGVDAVMHTFWEVTTPIEEETSIECSGCKASCNGRKISIERDAKFDIIHICVHDSCSSVSDEKSDFAYIVPNEYLHVTEFNIMFFRSDGKGQFTQRVACLDSHVCTSIHCDVCTERFANPHCYKFVNWVILILMATSLILVFPILCLLYKVSRFIFAVFLLPAGLAYKLARVIFKKCSRKSYQMASNTSARLTQFVNDDEAAPVARPGKRPLLRASLVIMFFITISCSHACENVISVDSKVLECLPSNAGEIKCAVNTVVDVALSSVGEESCINVNEQSGTIVQIIKLKTTSIRQKCSKSVLYYTCDGDFKLLNAFRCRNAGDCTDEICESVKSKGPVPVPSVDSEKAGYHGCSRVTGFWGKGCFLANQACQFYKVELQNKNKMAFEVSKCSEWYWEIKVNITVQSKDGVKEQQLVLDTTLPQKSIIGLSQIQSISAPTNSDTSKCFIRKLSSGMKTAISVCSERNNPIIGKIGGIQCAAPTLAEQGSKSCLVDSNTIQIVVQDDNVVFVNRFANVSEIWRANLLPSNLSGSVISEESNGQIYIHHTTHAAYSMKIKMKDYKISYTVTRPKCEAHFRSLKGCANCGAGAVLEVEISINNAIRTPVKITCPSAAVPGVQLALSSIPVTNFKMIFTSSEIEEKCSVECAGNSVEINVKGTLISNIKIRNQTDNSIIGKGADFFASLPIKAFGFLRYFYLFIGVIVALPVIVVTFYLLSLAARILAGKLCSRRKSRSKSH